MAIFRILEPTVGKLHYRNFLHQTFRVLVMLMVVTFTCAVGLYLLDETPRATGLRLFDAIWDAANTITTLGDLTDLTRRQEAFLLVAMFTLMIVGGYAITTLTGILASSEVLAFRENRKVARMLSRLNHHDIVVGFSKVGELLAEKLRADGSTVLIVDRDPQVTAAASAKGYLVVEGLANEEATLQQAQISRARALMLTTENTTERLSVTLMARALNPNLYLLAIGLTEPGRNWLMHAGASDVVLVDRIVADSLHEKLVKKLKAG